MRNERARDTGNRTYLARRCRPVLLAQLYYAGRSNLNFFVKNRQKRFAIELMNFVNSIAKKNGKNLIGNIFTEFQTKL